MIDRETLLELLHVDVLSVTFTKKDGTERVMRCTLREDLLPLREAKEDRADRKVNNEVIPVWDIDKKAFRSFRIDSIKQVQSSPGAPDAEVHD